MMKPDKKAKWIVGITGTALSAFILSQLNTGSTSNTNNPSNQQVAYQTDVSKENTNKISEREQDLANKDWTNFTTESNKEARTNQQTDQSTTDQQVDQRSTNQSVDQPAIQQQPVNPPTDRNTSRS